MRLWPLITAAVVVALGLGTGFYLFGSHPGGERKGILTPVAWQRMASPGPLSQAHAFLEHNCSACHTPVSGVEAANCIACHANDRWLLQRQPTAFHADIGDCAKCHAEHQGVAPPRVQMDHELFAQVTASRIKPATAAGPTEQAAAGRPAAFLKSATRATPPHAAISSREASLDCNSCHGNQDRHRQFFGTDCAQCHGTRTWTIPEFRHPSATSTDCAQCHQAPPSHFMMHFEMVSMKVARQEHASVSQCYLCHETTSWNDIRGIGWYKHH